MSRHPFESKEASLSPLDTLSLILVSMYTWYFGGVHQASQPMTSLVSCPSSLIVLISAMSQGIVLASSPDLIEVYLCSPPKVF